MILMNKWQLMEQGYDVLPAEEMIGGGNMADMKADMFVKTVLI